MHLFNKRLLNNHLFLSWKSTPKSQEEAITENENLVLDLKYHLIQEPVTTPEPPKCYQKHKVEKNYKKS